MELTAIDDYALKQIEEAAQDAIFADDPGNPMKTEIALRQFRRWADPATVLSMVIRIRELEAKLTE